MDTSDETGLWNNDVDLQDEQVRTVILSQYQACLDQASQVSDRRTYTNLSLLVLQIFLLLMAGFLAVQGIDVVLRVVLCVAAIALSTVWALLLRSYRNLNTAKFKVIGELETKLPATPLYGAEWQALGEGKDWRKHIPLTPIENLMPPVLGVLHLVVLVLA